MSVIRAGSFPCTWAGAKAKLVIEQISDPPANAAVTVFGGSVQIGDPDLPRVFRFSSGKVFGGDEADSSSKIEIQIDVDDSTQFSSGFSPQVIDDARVWRGSTAGPALLQALPFELRVPKGSELRILSGTIFLDKFGERLFLNVHPGVHVNLEKRAVVGGQTIRVLGGGTNFENEILPGEDAHVSVAARLATAEELQSLAPSQLSDPTVTATKVVRFEAIQNRAFSIFETTGGPAEVDWLRAERELLGL